MMLLRSALTGVMEPRGAFWVNRRVDAGAGHADPELGPAAMTGPAAIAAAVGAPA
jgi:hypothetical protein